MSNSSLFQLIYSSYSRMPALLPSEVSRLVQGCFEVNRKLGITGLLLYDGNQFVQLIEGPEESVREVYSKIETDPRHQSVEKLFERKVTKRHFGSWHMGYRSTNKDELQRVLEADPKQPASMLSVIKQLVIERAVNEGGTIAMKPRLLVVDDSPTNRKVLSSLLKKHYTVELAVNGEEALSTASRIRPELILLDIDMPGLDGYEVCARLSDNPLTEDIPVIFVSALSDTAHKVTGLSLGACDYVTKPLQREEVLARVSTHLEMGRLRRDLRRSMKELEDKNQRLERFSRSLAHDLRSPLTSVIGHASLLKLEKGLSESATQSIDCIRCAGENLNETVDSLLLMAIADHGEMEMVPLDVQKVAETCRSDIHDMIREYEGTITLESEGSACLGYGPWMRRVLTNLFTNGLKYGGTHPQIVFSAKPGAEGMVRYVVKDNGDGLSDEQIGKLFNEFTRFSPETAPGIGLGLALVKSLIHQMGGRIHVESSKETGTAFMIDMPSLACEAMAPDSATAA